MKSYRLTSGKRVYFIKTTPQNFNITINPNIRDIRIAKTVPDQNFLRNPTHKKIPKNNKIEAITKLTTVNPHIKKINPPINPHRASVTG